VIARKEYITQMRKIRGPYDINMAGYYAAYAALEDAQDMERYTNEVMNKAKPLIENFFSSKKIPYYPSSANFILFRPNNPQKVLALLKQAGVLIRPQNKQNVKGTLRVSIGTKKQMQKFIEIYKKVLYQTKKPKYAFLDRDGTLIHEPQDTYQIDSIKKLKLLDGVIDGLQALQRKGYSLVLISNQDGLGTRTFPRKDFEAPQKKMLTILSKKGICFEHIFICPHFSQDKCECRKPKTGLVNTLLQTTQIDKKYSFVCGDRQSDQKFAKNIGLQFMSMRTNANFYQAIKSVLT